MLLRILLENWENHEKTVLDNFSEGFNLIHGASDSGKSSVVRALRLVAYNEFDPESVRLGHDNCRVTVETDKGIVRVTRGKENKWEVKPRGGKKQVFTRIGKKILKEAADIIGMRMIEIGDFNIPVNLMNQSEGHFMLKEVGGKNSSGSLRAQIIDEISGLTGVEDLVRSVSLDNTRSARKLKELENSTKELYDQLHDEAEMDREKALLNRAEKLLKDQEETVTAVVRMKLLHSSWEKTSGDLEEAQEDLSELPDPRMVKIRYDSAKDATDMEISAKKIMHAFASESQNRKNAEAKRAALPDTKKAAAAVSSVDGLLSRISLAISINKAAADSKAKLEEAEERLRRLPSSMVLNRLFNDASDKTRKIEDIYNLLTSVRSTSREIEECQKKLEANEESVRSLYDERDELLQTITLCPLTMQPVGPECFKDMRVPVTTKKQAKRLINERIDR